MRGTSTITPATTATSTRTTTQKRRRSRAAPRLLVLLVGWTLAIFAHVYVPTIVPLAIGALVLAAFAPPRILSGSSAWLDVSLLLVIAAMAAELVPLPPSLRASVAPAAVAIDRTLLFTDGTANQPLSIDPAATAWAVVVVGAVMLVFWSARTLFAGGGVRVTVRGIAWIGLVLAPLAIVQHVIPLPGLDGVWGLNSTRLRPYGPFVNRNDFAAWLVMAIPLTVGYLMARIESRRHDRRPSGDLVDERTVWFGGAAALMSGGLFFSASRSGLLGAMAGLLAFAMFARRRGGTRAWVMVAIVGLAAAAGTLVANIGAVVDRFAGSAGELAGRVSIWRETWPIVRDFWPWGAGAGSYERAMLVYQTRSRLFAVSHADNELLEILAEGGLLVGIPVALVLVTGVGQVVRQLGRDRTPMVWIRAGAVAGLLAVAVQNMVEMTLRVPANGLLFAVLAAIALHEPAARPEGRALQQRNSSHTAVGNGL